LKRKNKLTIILLMALFLAVPLVAFAALEFTAYGGHKNGKVEGYGRTDVAMFRATPRDSRFYTEVWFHEIQFPDTGAMIIVNFQRHNISLRKGGAEAYLTYSAPGRPDAMDRMSLGPDQIKFDPQGFGISFGNSRVELKGDQYIIKYRGETIQADITYDILVPSFQQGDGMLRFTKSGDFVRYNFPIPWATATGTITIGGKTQKLNGHGSMNHDYQILSPTRVMGDWRALWLYGENETISVVRCSSPDLDGKWIQRLMVAEKGKILFSSHDYKFEDLGTIKIEGSNVPCAAGFKLSVEHGGDWLRGEVKVTSVQEKGELLQYLPSLMKRIADLIVEETWTYRFWCDYEFEFSIDGQVRTIKGKGTGNYVASVETDK